MKQLELFSLTDARAHTPAHTYTPIPICDTTRRIDQAIRLIRAYDKWKPLTLAYSGGKDSDVVLQLTRLAGCHVTVVYNSTTIDPPGTISHVLQAGGIIQRPKYTFFQLVEKKGLPSLWRRFCCEVLKEQFIGTPVLLGIRASESNKRKKRYIDPTICRIYSKRQYAEQVFPILYWDETNLFEFVTQENITLHPLYYVNGNFDPKCRLGCIGCPLQSDRGRRDFLKYPKFLKRLCEAFAVYVQNHNSPYSVYDKIAYNILYSNHHYKQYSQTFHGLFQYDSRELLSDYFHINLPKIP